MGMSDQAIALGLTFLDTADMYGPDTNEELVGRALRGRRDEVVLATKFALLRGEDGRFIGVCGRPDHVRASCDASIQRLGVDHIDLYDQHRVDRTVPILASRAPISRRTSSWWIVSPRSRRRKA